MLNHSIGMFPRGNVTQFTLSGERGNTVRGSLAYYDERIAKSIGDFESISERREHYLVVVYPQRTGATLHR